jgi:hypothetical protein
MLSVGKLAAGPDAGRYYEDTLALGREDYYAGEGEGSGRWLGAGAVALGLDGEVQGGQTVRLLSGEHPTVGTLLGRPMDDGAVAGFDLTFNAPKSIGLAFALGDPTTARLLTECHTAAVNDALAYLEREACRARRGRGGAQVVEGRGFAAAAFDHRTSRAGDPLLHTHVVVVNRTLGDDGRWTALDARPVYRHARRPDTSTRRAFGTRSPSGSGHGGDRSRRAPPISTASRASSSITSRGAEPRSSSSWSSSARTRSRRATSRPWKRAGAKTSPCRSSGCAKSGERAPPSTV